MRAIILLGILCSLLSAEPREALLIGNSNYQDISKLKNPKADLKRLKSTLESLGFTVKIKTNLNSENLEEAIDVFAERLAKNRSTIGFLYYTGHGCQVERQGYLLPINVNSSKRIKVKHNALKINEMIETLKDSGNRVNMFFLDACRDVPLGTKGSSKSLGQIKNTPKGTLVVYATKDGETAEDNSDFINSIISSIKEPKQNIRNLPYSISDTFKRGTTSQMPIFSAVDIPKIVLNTKGGYVPPVVFEQEVVPIPAPKPKPSPTSKWLKPSSSTCTQNGGKMVDGVCKANWENAKKICRASGASLPSIDDLRKVVTDCGGVINDYGNNINNSNYQTCYNQKGFTLGWYWSSTKIGSSSAWGVGFLNALGGWDDKTGGNNYALCVR